MAYTQHNGGRSNESRSIRARLATLVMAAALGGAALTASPRLASAQSVSADMPERGVTRPKHEPKLSFYSPGVIAKMNVEEGQAVKAGEVLAVQDDRAEMAELIKMQGDYTIALLQVEAALADVEQKRVALKRKTELYAELIANHGSNTELEEAEVAVKIGDIAVKYRKGEVDKAALDVKAAELKRDLRKLVSPVDGIVAKIDVRVGEGSDLTKPVMQVVQTTTLCIEADVPVSKAKALRVGDTLMVSYLDEKEKWMSAKVVYLTPYANAGSASRKIRLEMANEGGREAGLAVFVQMKKADGGAAASAK